MASKELCGFLNHFDKRFLIFSIVVVQFFAGCAQVNEPTAQPATRQAVPDQVETIEPAGISPTEVSQPKPTDLVVVEATEPTIPEPTPIPCTGSLTSPNQEGPYYSAGSPERASLVDKGLPGTTILILGRVFDQDCYPIPGAKLDFWLADVEGVYDNVGYKLRGHVFSDENGYYKIGSIEPGLYTGRPPHIHVKVFAPDGRELLTTQIYFPGSEESADVGAAPDLLATYLPPDEDGRQRVLFNFIVQY